MKTPYTFDPVEFTEADNYVKLPKRLREAIETGTGEAVLEALTDKQKMFAKEYLKDLNASRAVLRAGYDTQNANRMGTQLKNHVGVQIALRYLQADREEQMNIDANFVLDKIIKSIGRAEQRQNEQAVLRGAELLARHLGMFIDKTEISGPEGEDIRMQQKVEEDVRDFTSAISRLATRGKEKSVPKPTVDGGEG